MGKYQGVLEKQIDLFLKAKVEHYKIQKEKKKQEPKFNTFFISSWLATAWESIRNWSGARRKSQVRQEAIRKKVAEYEAVYPNETKALYFLIEIAWIVSYVKRTHIPHNKHKEIVDIMKKYNYLLQETKMPIQQVYDLLSAEIEYSLEKSRYKEEEILINVQYFYQKERQLRCDFKQFIPQLAGLGLFKDPDEEYDYIVTSIINMIVIFDYPDETIKFFLFKKLYPNWENMFVQDNNKLLLDKIDQAGECVASLTQYIAATRQMLAKHHYIKRSYTTWSRPVYILNKAVDQLKDKNLDKILTLKTDHPYRYAVINETLESESISILKRTLGSAVGLGVLMLITKGIVLFPIALYDAYKAGYPITKVNLNNFIELFAYVEWLPIIMSVVLSFVFLFVVALAQRHEPRENARQINCKINNILGFDNKNKDDDRYPISAAFTEVQEFIRKLLYIIAIGWSLIVLYFLYQWINHGLDLPFELHFDPVHFITIFLFIGFSGGISFYLKEKGEEINIVKLGPDWIQIIILLSGLGLPVIVGKIVGHWVGDTASSALPWVFDRLEPFYKILVWFAGERELRWIERFLNFLGNFLRNIKQKIADFTDLLSSVFHK